MKKMYRFSALVLALVLTCIFFPLYAFADYYPAVEGYDSIVDALDSICVDSSFRNRELIAAENGIGSYRGSAEQNKLLLSLLKNGKLRIPGSSAKEESLNAVPLESAVDEKYYPRVTGYESLVDALEAIHVDSSFAFRARIAESNSIESYRGSADQNTAILNLLQSGRLIIPDISTERKAFVVTTISNTVESSDYSSDVLEVVMKAVLRTEPRRSSGCVAKVTPGERLIPCGSPQLNEFRHWWIPVTYQGQRAYVYEDRVIKLDCNDLLSCEGYVNDDERRTYIDQMMVYYLNTNEQLRSALDDGLSVVFAFEGGSEHASSSYQSPVRNQAIFLVVRKVNDMNVVVYGSDDCSTLPGRPENTDGTANKGSTTIYDGVYEMVTTNHNDDFGALNLVLTQSYYTPSFDPDGFSTTAEGINIHTRNVYAYEWSEGCQLIGHGNSSENEFNQFLRQVLPSLEYDVWINYKKKEFNKIEAGKSAGYYVVDRQLAREAMQEIYTETAIEHITAFSRDASEKSRECLETSDFRWESTFDSTLQGKKAVVTKKNGFYPRTEPYDVASKGAKKVSCDTELTILGAVTNKYNNKWFLVYLKDRDQTFFAYSGWLDIP